MQLQKMYEDRMNARLTERKASGAAEAMTAWGRDLMQLQEELQARMNARPTIQDLIEDEVMAAWRQDLLKDQEDGMTLSRELMELQRQQSAGEDGHDLSAWRSALEKDTTQGMTFARGLEQLQEVGSEASQAELTEWVQDLQQTQQ